MIRGKREENLLANFSTRLLETKRGLVKEKKKKIIEKYICAFLEIFMDRLYHNFFNFSDIFIQVRLHNVTRI